MGKVLKYISHADIIVDITKFYNGADIEFNDFRFRIIKSGHIRNGILTIKRDFMWDGCTPKFRLFGFIFGIPDFPETYIASAVHDFLIKHQEEHTMSRLILDNIFEYILYQENFKYAWLYSSAVHMYRHYKEATSFIV